ncbi:MAG TPA: glycoside hydrolase family 57 protein, partial [Anaerolineaceae bacterium]|nr:glycoside hydrolase family 57 protein [Anaerolineaceae bacterium]
TRPWVRVHATKDYYDMASILEQYPDVKITFNLTPVLIRQLDDFVENGTIDLYWQYSLIPADELTQTEKEFILTRFFDANWENIIARFPRYQELLRKRGGTSTQEISTALEEFTSEDFRDLQIWFNLAWFDPDFLEAEPLNDLVSKQRGFTEEDKVIVFNEASRVMEAVIPMHKTLQDKGQIEVITTPYAHPILPLLIDSNIARIGNPSTDLPSQFSYPQDAISHLEISKEIYEDHFGISPKGLWPGEGSVAQLMVPHVINAEYEWMASGEPVLAKSLGIDSFTRNSDETVNEADQLYRPYFVKNQKGEKLAVFFRDGVISDKIGFTYSGMSGSQAANDLMGRLENIRDHLKSTESEGPHIVSIIVDGENAWEYYKNDGKEFFHAFYQSLSDSTTIKTITPSAYLELFPNQREIEDLFPGAWFSPNYDTWIGEEEENQAWEYLRQTREVLAKYDISKLKSAPEENIAEALDFMYLAEGSDWFWWYGDDQDSGQDSYFDEGFRALLRNVFISIGEPVPGFVNVPIIQDKAVSSDEPVSGLSTPIIDGFVTDEEWDTAGLFIGQNETALEQLKFTYDSKNIYFLLDNNRLDEDSRIGIYFKSSKGSQIGFPYTFSQGVNTRLLGTSATHLFEWANNKISYYKSSQSGWQLQNESASNSQNNDFLEILIPINEIGEFDAGDELQSIVLE